MADVDPIRAGIYAWGIYGVLCFTNYIYYGDRFYWNYTTSPWSANASFGFRSIWGFASWFRDFTLWAGWSATALLWALSAFGNVHLIKMFAYVSTFLINMTMFRVVAQVVLHVAGLLMDTYSHDLNVFNYWDSKVWGFSNKAVPASGRVYKNTTTNMYEQQAYYSMSGTRNRDMPSDYAWIDFLLEGVNIAIQLVAYPMLQLGISEGLRKWDQQMEGGAKPAPAEPAKAPAPAPVAVKEDEETDSWL